MLPPDSSQEQYRPINCSRDVGLLSFVLFNARSLNKKLFDLQYLLCNDKPDILCITETWLQPALPNSLIVFDSNYSVFRTDRSSDRTGGGVCILTSNATIKATSVAIPSKFLHLELCAVDISFGKVKLRLFVCYRPPSSYTDVYALQYAKDICTCIDKLFPVDSPVIICGDFNLPNVDWSVDNCSLCCDSTCDGVFLEMYYNHGLRQFVPTPTRLDSFLDLVFSNDHNCIFNPRTADPFSTSDHNQVHFEIPLAMPTSQRERIGVIHDFKNANWAEIKNFLNTVDFYHLFNNNEPPDSVIKSFYDIIYTCVELFVPCKHITTFSNMQHIKYPYSVQRLMKKKTTAWRVFRTFGTQESLASYKNVALKCKTAIRKFT